MRKGYIKFYRRFIFSDLWLSEKFTRGQAWVDLITLANHADGFIRKRGIKVEVKRGQCGYSELALADRWQWSRGKVRRFLNELEAEQQIVQQKNEVTTLITIVNYSQYQGDGTTNNTTNDTTNGQQTDTNNKNKNDKKNNIYTSSFLKFWETYPKKTGKGDAFKAWRNIKNPKPTTDEIIQAVQKYNQTEQWQTTKYIPNPATFLNRRQWEDEIGPDGGGGTHQPKKQKPVVVDEKTRREMYGDDE